MHFRVATDHEISNYPYPNEKMREANRTLAWRDRQALINWGIAAAKRAGKRAFWLDFECVRNEDEDGVARTTSDSDEVYQICDIVRAAHSMIIAIGPSASDKVAAMLAGEDPPAFARDNVTPWLRQWGSRLWTLPELLLCPGEHRIQLYVAGDSSRPKSLAKRNFVERAWEDAEAVKVLVNHFEGSAILSQEHLIEAALICFSRRQTDRFSPGDIAYAIMGLFPSSHRPSIDKQDSGFQAFAKLCLANSSAAFLVQLMSVVPEPGSLWYEMIDTWGANVRDIYPTCRVSEVLAPNTLRLDGVHGATIHWDNLDPEPLFEDTSKHRSYLFCLAIIWSVLLLRLVFLFLIPLMTILSRNVLDTFDEKLNFAYFIYPIGAFNVPCALLGPILLLSTRNRHQRPVKPRLIGIEGSMDAGSVEKQLWGFNHGRLKDTTPPWYEGSNESGPSPSAPAGPAAAPGTQDGFEFTLVDTDRNTVTRFRSQTPPVAMFVCGEERHGQRAILCSYDWRQRTFQRQAVLRIDRRKLDRMHQLDGVRLSLVLPSNKARSESTVAAPATSQSDLEVNGVEAKGQDNKLPPDTTTRMWIRDAIFLVFFLVSFTIASRGIF